MAKFDAKARRRKGAKRWGYGGAFVRIGIYGISICADGDFLYNRNPAKGNMDDFRAAISDFCPVIPAKAGIQRGDAGLTAHLSESGFSGLA